MAQPFGSPNSCQPSSSLDGREEEGWQDPSLPLGPRRGNIFPRLNDSLVGAVIGAVSLFITLVGLLILGVGLS